MKTSRIIIADDHPIVRQGLAMFVATNPNLIVVAEAADGDEAERIAREVPADLLLLDIALPKKSGIQVLAALRAGGISLPVLLFSMHPASQYAGYARRNGAQGYLAKATDPHKLLQVIQRILAGGTFFSDRSRPAVEADPFASLSRREMEIMHGLLRGESLVTIANRLGIGPKSVSTYRRRVLDKLGVQTNVELVALAARYGIA